MTELVGNPETDSNSDPEVVIIEDSEEDDSVGDYPDAQQSMVVPDLPEPIEGFSSDTDPDKTQELFVEPQGDDDVPGTPLRDDASEDDDNTPQWIHRVPVRSASAPAEVPAAKRARLGPE